MIGHHDDGSVRGNSLEIVRIYRMLDMQTPERTFQKRKWVLAFRKRVVDASNFVDGKYFLEELIDAGDQMLSDGFILMIFR